MYPAKIHHKVSEIKRAGAQYSVDRSGEAGGWEAQGLGRQKLPSSRGEEGAGEDAEEDGRTRGAVDAEHTEDEARQEVRATR